MPAAKSLSLLRFSIRHLLIGTALIGLACVALRSASATWVAVMLALVLVSLTASLLLLIFRQGAARAYWTGFAVVGGLYVLVLINGWGLDPNTTYNHPLSPQNLITGQLAVLSYDWLYSSPVLPYPPPTIYPTGGGSITVTTTQNPIPVGFAGNMPASPASWTFNVAAPTAPALAGPAQHDFVNVAHGLWALLLAACGGWFARWLYVTRPIRAADDPT